VFAISLLGVKISILVVISLLGVKISILVVM